MTVTPPDPRPVPRVTPEALAAINALKQQVNQVTDDHARAITAAYARAWDLTVTDLQAALHELTAAAKDGRVTAAQVRRSRRLAAALDHIGTRLDEAARAAGVRVMQDIPTAAKIAGEGNHRILTRQVPPRAVSLLAGWDRVDKAAIDAIVARTTQQITVLWWPLSGEATASIKSRLVRGITVGDNPRATAARMVADVQGDFNGGLARAVNIARTETLDAMRAATALHDQANRDVITGWVWVATLAPRTCPACVAMHGTEHPPTDPGPLGHQSCRCVRAPLTKSWRDLGVDIDEPASALPDKHAWFDSLTPAQRQQLLGPARYQAWQDGRYPMSSWATRRTNEGWRDSIVVSPVPD